MFVGSELLGAPAFRLVSKGPGGVAARQDTFRHGCVLSRLESSFVLNLRLDVPAPIAPMLFTAAASWRKIKADELDRPMRCALLVCLFAELKERLIRLSGQQEQVDKMAGMAHQWHPDGVEPPAMGCGQSVPHCRHEQDAAERNTV